MSGDRRVIVVGAGLAGLGAAAVLLNRGLHVVVVDEGSQPGGQYLKRPDPAAGLSPALPGDSLRVLGLSLIDRVAAGASTLMPGAQAVGADGSGNVWAESREGRIVEMKAEAILFATGARERFIPFDGWTLPGVISAGAVQLLLKTCAVLPARRLIAAGCGPLPTAVSAQVSAAGVRVPALLDHTWFLRQGGFLFRLAAHPSRLVEAGKNLLRLAAAGVRVRPGTAVVEARGDDVVEEVVSARLDRKGEFIPGSEKVLRTGCLAVGHGFAANIELPQAAGCGLAFDGEGRGWVVAVDGSMRTSIPGIYAAGEVTGIAGARKSFIEGGIAGHCIAEDLGFPGDRRDRARIDSLRRSLGREKSFGRLMGRICTPPAGIWGRISDDNVVCRCEDVTVGDVRRSLATGAGSLGGIKRATRCGMGMCQGRTCGPVLHDLLSARAVHGGRETLPFSAHLPVKPIDVSSILDSMEKQKRRSPG